MSGTFTVACIQNCAGNDIERNLAECEGFIREAAAAGAQLLCLPEYFSCLTRDDAEMLALALPEAGHPALERMRALAAELGCWLLAGSIAVRLGARRIANRSYLLDASGAVVASYDKVHLFDVRLRGGESYCESAVVQGGGRAVVAGTPWGGLGLSICYDLRFAYLYRRLAQRGARYLAIPAAFTQTTGEAHWHVLQRARAIETGSYVFAPGQCGVRSWGRATYGHSLIVDPWGVVLAEAGTEPGFVLAHVDPARVDEVRGMIPALEHDRTLVDD